jgi:glycerol-3-phosphate dehydrogenase (NAD(P)+)
MNDRSPIERIAVIGAGAWGTALAQTARRAGRRVKLWARKDEVVEQINRNSRNPTFQPRLVLDAGIVATPELGEAVDGAEAVLLVVPAQYLRAMAAQLAGVLAAGTPIVICAKGIERMSGQLMSSVVADDCRGMPIAVLSGPTFAIEVARGLPTAVTLATADAALGQRLVAALGTRSFRPYLSDDPIGAQIGGAVKNVIAIACGIVEGRQLGENARAALMTRGLAEMMRLGARLGAKRDTLMGLSGLGDLALTCNSDLSRNMSLGIAIGEGKSLAQAQAGKRSVAEGVDGAAAVRALADKLEVDMPIAFAVDAILHHGAAISDTIDRLLARSFKVEG